MDILIKNMEMPKEGSITITIRHDGIVTLIGDMGSNLGRLVDCTAIPVVHCKDCENFNKETDICTLWGSWTSEDGFCHKAVVLERTT